MKLATVERHGTAVLAVLTRDDKLLLVADAQHRRTGEPAADLGSMLATITAGARAIELIHELVQDPVVESLVEPHDVRFLPPIPRAPVIRDFGCFLDHFRNVQARWTGTAPESVQLPQVMVDHPLYYLVNPMAAAGHEWDVSWPSYSQLRDYELELACVIGRPGRDITPDHALDHVFGFTIFNDFTARDTQLAEMQSRLTLSKSKDFDGGNVFGPYIVTIDEIDDLSAVDMRARINGVEVSHGSTSQMDHSLGSAIAFTSQSTTLHPGEILCSGTVPTGCGLEHGQFLEPGDVVELEVEGIGTLRNRVVVE